MCLTLTNSPLEFVEGKRTCYKVVEKNIDTGEYRSFFEAIPHSNIGWMLSDRDQKELNSEEKDKERISFGIHVLNDLDAVRTFNQIGFYVEPGWEIVVLELECHLEDFVANGEFKATNLLTMSSSVWMKVWIKGEVDVPESATARSAV